jgi:flagellar hook assembly protein FlgD
MPNPFNPTTSLRFRTRTAGYVRVRIYGPHGRAIRTLLDTPFLGAGYHDVEFDGHDNSGNRVASGIYFYRIETAGGSQSGRVTLLK